MSKFDEFLLVLTFYFIKGWKIIVPLTIGAIFFAGFFAGSTAEAGYLWTN